MILQDGDKRRKKFLKEGDVLKRMRNTGGGGKGLLAGGAVLFGDRKSTRLNSSHIH